MPNLTSNYFISLCVEGLSSLFTYHVTSYRMGRKSKPEREKSPELHIQGCVDTGGEPTRGTQLSEERL